MMTEGWFAGRTDAQRSVVAALVRSGAAAIAAVAGHLVAL